MLGVGIAVLVVSIIVERAVTIRGARLVNKLGGDWDRRELVYAREGDPPAFSRWSPFSRTRASSPGSC
jgi:hypothetical protein